MVFRRREECRARRSEAEARISFMVVTRDPDKVGADGC